MGEHELILDANELRHIIFECEACGCRVCVAADPENTLNERPFCPGCGASMPEMARLFADYKKLFDRMTAVSAGGGATGKFKVKFRLPLPSDRIR